MLGALVVEEGGALRHAAVVAREFDVPAVVGALGAMTIPDGATIEVEPPPPEWCGSSPGDARSLRDDWSGAGSSPEPGSCHDRPMDGDAPPPPDATAKPPAGAPGLARLLTVLAILALVLGALVWGAAAASSDFDLGADLELGQPVHGTAVGPPTAWLAAALLVGIAVVSWFDTQRAASLLVWIAAVAVGLTGGALVVRAISGRFEVGDLQVIPFVVAFFVVPTLVTAVILWLAGLSAGTGASSAERPTPPG